MINGTFVVAPTMVLSLIPDGTAEERSAGTTGRDAEEDGTRGAMADGTPAEDTGGGGRDHLGPKIVPKEAKN